MFPTIDTPCGMLLRLGGALAVPLAAAGNAPRAVTDNVGQHGNPNRFPQVDLPAQGWSPFRAWVHRIGISAPRLAKGPPT